MEAMFQGVLSRGTLVTIEKCLTITREDFGKAQSLFAYVLDRCDFGEDYINLIKRGSTRLETSLT